MASNDSKILKCGFKNTEGMKNKLHVIRVDLHTNVFFIVVKTDLIIRNAGPWTCRQLTNFKKFRFRSACADCAG